MTVNSIITDLYTNLLFLCIIFCSKKEFPQADNYRAPRHDIINYERSIFDSHVGLHRDPTSNGFNHGTINLQPAYEETGYPNDGRGVETGVDDATYF